MEEKKWDVYFDRVSNLHWIFKLVLWLLITLILHVILTFTVGIGNGVDKVLFWEQEKVKLFVLITNELVYVILFAIIYLTFRILNRSYGSEIFIFIQLVWVWININSIQYGFDGIVNSFKISESIWEYVIWILMILNAILLISMCIIRIRKLKNLNSRDT